MTKTLSLLVVALACLLALTLGAPAAAEATPRLTVKQAERLAKKLGRKQMRRNHVKRFYLGKPRRLSRTAIAFPYRARTRGNTHCRATLRVKRRRHGNRIDTTARIGRQRCTRMPADALAMEAALKAALRGIRFRATFRAIMRVVDSSDRCAQMRVPRSRRTAAEAIDIVAILGAGARPNRRMQTRFLARIERIETTHGVLRAGIAAWIDHVRAWRALPAIPYPCAALRRWRDAGWAWDEAPIDMAAYRAADRRTNAAAPRVERASRWLGRAGVEPRLANSFNPGILLFFFSG